jgi:hypothetical protein
VSSGRPALVGKAARVRPATLSRQRSSSAPAETPPRFRTIQACPKDLPVSSGATLACGKLAHSGFRGGAHGRPKTTRVDSPARRRGGGVADRARAQQPAMPVIGFLMPASVASWLHLVGANVSTKAVKATTSAHRVSHNALYFHDFIKTPCAPSENSAAQCEVLHTSKVDLDGIII